MSTLARETVDLSPCGETGARFTTFAFLHFSQRGCTPRRAEPSTCPACRCAVADANAGALDLQRKWGKNGSKRRPRCCCRGFPAVLRRRAASAVSDSTRLTGRRRGGGQLKASSTPRRIRPSLPAETECARPEAAPELYGALNHASRGRDRGLPTLPERVSVRLAPARQRSHAA